MNKHITEKNCAGCLACENICPKSAISHNTKVGFIRPVVDSSKCIGCKFCLNVCPQINIKKYDSSIQQTYAVKHMDKSILKESTSGGAFSSLAENTIKNSGIIYGCEIINQKAVHVRTDSNYCGMRGSKYIQSDLNFIYNNILNDLSNGKRVLFTGTPCQCAAVKNYLNLKKISIENLIMVDFICHGTTSPSIYSDYILYYEAKKKQKILAHLFRSKINGWTKHTEVNLLENGQSDWQSYESQLFKGIYYSHLGMNDACFNCKFATINRVSDITLADFWGIQKNHPELFDENGVSFVLINSLKGKKIFDECENIEKHLVKIEDADQPMLYRPIERPKAYSQFWHDYRRKGFDYIVKKYFHGGHIYRTISNIYHAFIKRKK